jgi:hypothetical protein
VLAQLECLELRGNKLSETSAAALVREAPNMKRLTWLTVSGNPLGPRAVKSLTEAFPSARVATRGAALSED